MTPSFQHRIDAHQLLVEHGAATDPQTVDVVAAQLARIDWWKTRAAERREAQRSNRCASCARSAA